MLRCAQGYTRDGNPKWSLNSSLHNKTSMCLILAARRRQRSAKPSATRLRGSGSDRSAANSVLHSHAGLRGPRAAPAPPCCLPSAEGGARSRGSGGGAPCSAQGAGPCKRRGTPLTPARWPSQPRLRPAGTGRLQGEKTVGPAELGDCGVPLSAGEQACAVQIPRGNRCLQRVLRHLLGKTSHYC